MTDPSKLAQVVGRAMIVTFPDGERGLFGEILIDCPHCGELRLSLPGHHMRVVRNLLIEWIDEHPELTGSDGQIKELGRTVVQGTAPADPSKN
jgi:hypothetical protein